MHRLQWYSTAMRHTGRGLTHGEEQAPAAASSGFKKQVHAQHLLQVFIKYLKLFQELAIAITPDTGAGEDSRED